jgi:hypothetical protein
MQMLFGEPKLLCLTDSWLGFRAKGWRVLEWDEAKRAPGPQDWLLVDAAADPHQASAIADRYGLPVAVIVSGAGAGPLVDNADALLFATDNPDEAAASLALRTTPARGVADLRENTASALNSLSAEASRIAASLKALVEANTQVPQGFDAGMIRTLLRIRREREKHLPADLFADPVWDMLLDLSLARMEGRPVSVSSLCIAAHVPASTGLRWIRSLTAAGLFVRTPDASDARRHWMSLSDEGWQAMTAYFAAVRPLLA